MHVTTRRGFFGRLAAVAAGAVAAAAAPSAGPRMFHRDAFKFAMAPLTIGTFDKAGESSMVVSGGRAYVFEGRVGETIRKRVPQRYAVRS